MPLPMKPSATFYITNLCTNLWRERPSTNEKYYSRSPSRKACRSHSKWPTFTDATSATRLCSEAPRLNDEYGLQSACSSAAATASLLYSQKLDIAELGPGHLSQRNARRPYGDAYAEDDKALCERAGLAEPERGRMYGRSAYGGSAYGGRSGRALSEGPSYGGRDYVGGAGTDGMGMAGSNIGGTGMIGTGMADSRDPRSQLGGIGSPPYAPGRVGTSIGMPDSPITGGASSYGGPPYPTDIPGSPYPARSVNSSYPTGAGGFAPSGVPDIQRAGSPILPGRGMDPTGFMPGSAYGAGFNQQANSTMPLQTGGQPGYPGLGGQAQPSYGGIYAASGQMHQPAYATNGAAGGMPQAVMNGAPGAMSQGGYGGVPVTGGMPGTMSGTMPQAAYGGVPQSIPGGMPGAMPQVPYSVAPPMLAHAAIPGAQVYPPGSTIVLPSRKKRRYRTRARSRDLAERDRYYRERRSGQQDGYESY